MCVFPHDIMLGFKSLYVVRMPHTAIRGSFCKPCECEMNFYMLSVVRKARGYGVTRSPFRQSFLCEHVPCALLCKNIPPSTDWYLLIMIYPSVLGKFAVNIYEQEKASFTLLRMNKNVQPDLCSFVDF